MPRTRDTNGYGQGPHPAWLDIDWSAHQRWLTVDGRAVNIVDAGPRDGDPILFIHGHSACWQHWLDQLVVFMETHRVIALDLPGFGRSAMPEELSMSGYGKVVEAVLDQLGVAAACVVGNSMGGFVAAETAIRFPQRVERLVLVAAAGMSGKYIGLPTAVMRHPTVAAVSRVLFSLSGMPEAQIRAMARRPRGRIAALGFVCTHADLLHPATVYEVLKATGAPGAAPAALALASYDFSGRVSDIACPTLIVWGDRDYLVPLASASEYERRLGDARKVVYDDTGHVPMIERPARFNEDLAAFLAEMPGESAPADAERVA